MAKKNHYFPQQTLFLTTKRIEGFESVVEKNNKLNKFDVALALSKEAQKIILQQNFKVPTKLLCRHIINRLCVLLNMNDYKEFDKEFIRANKYLEKRKLPENVQFKMCQLQCDKELRVGCFNVAIKLADKKLKITKDNRQRCHLFIIKGIAELALNSEVFQVNSLSDALAEAEASGDNMLIARVYMELAHMFELRYCALGLYFLRKAEVLYIRGKHYYELNIEYMYRAMNSLLVYERKTNVLKVEGLKKEAERLINIIDGTLFRMESDKWYFQRLKAYIFKQEELLYDVLEYYKKIDAKPEIERTSEMFIGICLNKGLNDKVRTMLPIYKEACSDNVEKLANIAKLEDMMKKNQHIVYESLFDRTEKETTLLDILDEISLEEEMWALDERPYRRIFPTYNEEGMFEIVDINGTASLFPCSLSYNKYYRGQNKYYNLCKASIHRRGLTEANIFVERLQYAELKLLIMSHPISKIYNEGIGVKHPNCSIQTISLNIDYLALAQHYGIKTELLDLTVDKFVAAFFACTDYDENSGHYSALLGDEGYGVFYIYFHSKFPASSQLERTFLRIVGLQPFSRPGEQAGYALYMKKEDDFNSICLKKKRFKHNASVAKFIFNYTNRQKKLFPKDILDSKVQIIKSTDSFSRNALELAIAEFYPNEDEKTIKEYLRTENISICETPIVKFTDEELDEFWKNWEEKGKQSFLNKIVPRSVCDVER